ncbi:MAG: inositol monophosphatase [Chloroflexi bacterium]|nr:inositol monophosphatase [Chloroflexota bacterium]
MDFARDLARGAGAILRQHFGQAQVTSQKGPIDFVTEADLASERFMVETIHRQFPEHGIITEETKEKKTVAEYTWVLDPLDGTINYLHGYPHFCVTVALRKGEEIILGVVYDPVRDELFWGERGKGAFLGEKRLQVSSTKDLIRALVTTGFPYDIATTPRTNLREFSYLALHGQGPRCSGSAALDLCYVAAGRLDGYWEAGVKPWDTAAGGLFVTEAGGMVSDYQGKPWHPFRGEVLATNGQLHPALVDALK